MNSIGAYKKFSKHSSVKKSDAFAKSAANNTDKIEFDFGRSLSAAQAGAASRVNEPAGEDRIAMLSRLYAGDNCPVSPREVAEAIIA